MNPVQQIATRNVPMMELEIESRVEQCLPNGTTAHIGKSIVTIYKDEYSQIRALVETQADGIERATIEDAALLDLAVKAAPDNADYIKKTWAGSIPAAFRKLFRRDLLPLISVKVLRDDIPPPAIQGQYGASDMIAKAIENGINRALAALLPQPVANHPQPQRNQSR